MMIDEDDLQNSWNQKLSGRVIFSQKLGTDDSDMIASVLLVARAEAPVNPVGACIRFISRALRVIIEYPVTLNRAECVTVFITWVFIFCRVVKLLMSFNFGK
jgi:hypothetical protein